MRNKLYTAVYMDMPFSGMYPKHSLFSKTSMIADTGAVE